jgi:hypothetical protein
VPEGLAGVAFRGPSGSLEVVRSGDELLARPAGCAQRGPELREPAPAPSLACALAAELEDYSGDPLLAEALPAAAALWE